MTAPTYEREQATLLRAADNADAAGVRTVNTTVPARAQARELARKIIADRLSYKRALLERELEAALAQQPEACDMGALCIGCEPRNADGTCPGQHPETWRAGFLAGAKWWEWETTGATMWQSDQQKAYEAALKKRPSPEAPAQEAVAWRCMTPYGIGYRFSDAETMTDMCEFVTRPTQAQKAVREHMDTTPPAAQVKQEADPKYRAGYAQGVEDSRRHECACARTYAGNPAAAQVQQEAVGHIIHSADAVSRFDLTPAGLALGYGSHPVYAHPAADALGAVRELQRYRMATDPEGDRAMYTDDTGSWLKLRDVESAIAQAPAVRVCKWWQQDEGYDTFSTDCGHEYTVNDCTDGNPNLQFCPYCAKRVEGHAWHPGDEPEQSQEAALGQGKGNG